MNNAKLGTAAAFMNVADLGAAGIFQRSEAQRKNETGSEKDKER